MLFFQIVCSPGFNGGLPQNFTVDVVENEAATPLDTALPVFRLESTEPVFAVGGLKDSTEYRVYVTPVNMKGVGQPQDPGGTLVRTNTEPKPLIEDPKNDGGTGGSGKGFLDGGVGENGDVLNPVMVMIFGGATGLVLILVTITLAAKIRCAHAAGRHGSNSGGSTRSSDGGGSLSRENSKVLVVTTIADLEFVDDKQAGSCDRLALNDPTGVAGLEHHRHEDGLYAAGGSKQQRRPHAASGDGSYMRLQPEQQQQQQQSIDYPPYLMYPPPSVPSSAKCSGTSTIGGSGAATLSAHAHNYCTLRKQHSVGGRMQQQYEGINEDTVMSTLLEQKQQQHADDEADDLSSPRELLLQMSLRDKHQAGFMYGTLRHHAPASSLQRHLHQHQLPPPPFGNQQLPPPGAVIGCRGDSEKLGGGGGGVVPPPPMFEEGGLIARPAAIGIGGGGSGTLKKCPGGAGKPEKKDKMESRV